MPLSFASGRVQGVADPLSRANTPMNRVNIGALRLHLLTGEQSSAEFADLANFSSHKNEQKVGGHTRGVVLGRYS